MPVIKGEMLFESGTGGWSESMYFDNPDITVLSTINGPLDKIAKARANLLGKFAKIAYLRTSDMAIDRDSYVAKTDYVGQLYAGNTAPYRADAPGLGWYVRVEAGSANRKSMFTLGMPDSWFERKADGAVEVPAELKSALAQYLNVVNAQGAKIQHITRTGIDFAKFKVSEIANLGGYLRVRTVKENPFEIGDLVQTYAFRNFRPALSGRYYITAVSLDPARWVTLDRQYNFTALGSLRVASLRKVVMMYSLINDMVPIRPGTRKIGRPFFLPVGRHRRIAK